MAEGRRENIWSRAGSGSLVAARTRCAGAVLEGAGGGGGSFSFVGEDREGLDGPSVAAADRDVDLPASRAITRA